MSQARETRNQIASIKNTQKITRAMELVAASKMRKAQDRMALSRPYSEKIRQVIRHVAGSHSECQHPYSCPPRAPMVCRTASVVANSGRNYKFIGMDGQLTQGGDRCLNEFCRTS